MIFNHDLYREAKCMFPARCEGIEHFLSKIQLNTPDVEFILNTRDWPQVIKHYGDPKPVFSFSKVRFHFKSKLNSVYFKITKLTFL